MMDNGILAGYSIDSMRVRLYDGQTHPVDSKPLAFGIMCEGRIYEAAKKCSPVLLEPIMKLGCFTWRICRFCYRRLKQKKRFAEGTRAKNRGSRIHFCWSTISRDVWLCDTVAYDHIRSQVAQWSLAIMPQRRRTLLNQSLKKKKKVHQNRISFKNLKYNWSKKKIRVSLRPILKISIKNQVMNQKIRIKLRSYDHNLVDKSTEKIVKR